MRIWIVLMDGKPDFASTYYGDVFSRYYFLVMHYGEKRVSIIHEDN